VVDVEVLAGTFTSAHIAMCQCIHFAGNLLAIRDMVNKSFVQIAIMLTHTYQSFSSGCWSSTAQPKKKINVFPKKQPGIE
jgi:hypothetical protein